MSRVGNVIEDTTDDESLEDVGAGLDQSGRQIAAEKLETSDHGEVDLLDVIGEVTLACALDGLRLARPADLVLTLSAELRPPLVALSALRIGNGALLVRLGKACVGQRGALALLHCAGVGVGDGDEEVRRRLTKVLFEAEFLEILRGTLSGTEVKHLAVGDQADFVEELVKRLGALVQRSDRGELLKVGGETERLHVFEGGAGVETAGGVVVCTDLGAGEQHLDDTDSLALATRNTPDDIVTNCYSIPCEHELLKGGVWQ